MRVKNPCQIDRPAESDFEKSLVTYCAPTLAGIKTGSIVNYYTEHKAELRLLAAQWNTALSGKGVGVTVLKERDNCALIYVYRPSALAKALQSRETSFFLDDNGYAGCRSLAGYLNVLRRRLGDTAQFPHEIGVFLGYPLHDVVGFIENEGHNYLACGLWKVYKEQNAAERRFHQLKMCTSVYKALHTGGKSAVQLTVAA